MKRMILIITLNRFALNIKLTNTLYSTVAIFLFIYQIYSNYIVEYY